MGNTSNATQGRDLYRYTFVDTMTWQKDAHRFRVRHRDRVRAGHRLLGLLRPGVRRRVLAGIHPQPGIPAATLGFLFPNLPTAIRTNQDFMNLPFAGGVVGVGDPGQPPPYNVDKAKVNSRLRFYSQDTWRIKPRFTLNYGLAWNFESTLVNRDLDKPAYLAPLYGSDLGPTENNYNNFSPVARLRVEPRQGQQDRDARRRGPLLGNRAVVAPAAGAGRIGPVGNGASAGAAYQLYEHLSRHHQSQYRSAGPDWRAAARRAVR